MELSRIRFVLNSYLRLRLEKLQNHVFYYTGTNVDENNRRLTQEEAAFAASYKKNVEEHFTALALRHLLGTWDSEKTTPALPKPVLSRAVFVKVKEDRPGLEVRDESGGG